MQIQVVKSKIHRVKVTGADLNYIGSITIDEDLMDAANIIQGEKIQVVNNSAQAFDISGNVFDGVFELDKYTLLKSQQTANVTFKDIDASKLITLDDKSGITLTGRLKGWLPLHFSDSGVEVTNGNFLNQGEGKLIISNNTAFESVMQQQQYL